VIISSQQLFHPPGRSRRYPLDRRLGGLQSNKENGNEEEEEFVIKHFYKMLFKKVKISTNLNKHVFDIYF
jgi:hypothetical protein